MNRFLKNFLLFSSLTAGCALYAAEGDDGRRSDSRSSAETPTTAEELRAVTTVILEHHLNPGHQYFFDLSRTLSRAGISVIEYYQRAIAQNGRAIIVAALPLQGGDMVYATLETFVPQHNLVPLFFEVIQTDAGFGLVNITNLFIDLLHAQQPTFSMQQFGQLLAAGNPGALQCLASFEQAPMPVPFTPVPLTPFRIIDIRQLEAQIARNISGQFYGHLNHLVLRQNAADRELRRTQAALEQTQKELHMTRQQMAAQQIDREKAFEMDGRSRARGGSSQGRRPTSSSTTAQPAEDHSSTLSTSLEEPTAAPAAATALTPTPAMLEDIVAEIVDELSEEVLGEAQEEIVTYKQERKDAKKARRAQQRLERQQAEEAARLQAQEEERQRRLEAAQERVRKAEEQVRLQQERLKQEEAAQRAREEAREKALTEAALELTQKTIEDAQAEIRNEDALAAAANLSQHQDPAALEEESAAEEDAGATNDKKKKKKKKKKKSAGASADSQGACAAPQVDVDKLIEDLRKFHATHNEKLPKKGNNSALIELLQVMEGLFDRIAHLQKRDEAKTDAAIYLLMEIFNKLKPRCVGPLSPYLAAIALYDQLATPLTSQNEGPVVKCELLSLCNHGDLMKNHCAWIAEQTAAKKKAQCFAHVQRVEALIAVYVQKNATNLVDVIEKGLGACTQHNHMQEDKLGVIFKAIRVLIDLLNRYITNIADKDVLAVYFREILQIHHNRFLDSGLIAKENANDWAFIATIEELLTSTEKVAQDVREAEKHRKKIAGLLAARKQELAAQPAAATLVSAKDMEYLSFLLSSAQHLTGTALHTKINNALSLLKKIQTQHNETLPPSICVLLSENYMSLVTHPSMQEGLGLNLMKRMTTLLKEHNLQAQAIAPLIRLFNSTKETGALLFNMIAGGVTHVRCLQDVGFTYRELAKVYIALESNLQRYAQDAFFATENNVFARGLFMHLIPDLINNEPEIGNGEAWVLAHVPGLQFGDTSDDDDDDNGEEA